jgi:hypothetical protein
VPTISTDLYDISESLTWQNCYGVLWKLQWWQAPYMHITCTRRNLPYCGRMLFWLIYIRTTKHKYICGWMITDNTAIKKGHLVVPCIIPV